MPDGEAIHDVRPESRHTHDLLAQILAEVKALRADLADRHKPVDASDRVLLEKLLPAVGGAVGSSWVTTAEALAHITVQVAAAGMTRSALGALLRRASEAEAMRESE